LFALVFSLTFHEFGHAITAYHFGDDTAKRAGRLTLNPLAHIDPFGLLMVIMIGVGFARPVPVDPRNYNSFWGELFVSAAGPAMNFFLAVFFINLYAFGLAHGWPLFQGEAAKQMFSLLALINMLLMLFNLLPIGPLDGHFILPYFLPHKVARSYYLWNLKYGTWALFGLIAIQFFVFPVLSYLFVVAAVILKYITFF
jgi:Zn-dependent protease